MSTAWRLFVVAIGLLATLLLLALGLALGVAVMVWSVLRGRRPRVMRFRVDPRSPFSGMRPQATKAHGEVVDIEAREVPDAKLPMNRK